jgi:hypothetical protein
MISAGTARTACQIYNDAVLAVYYPFNSNGILNDYSASLYNGFGFGITSLAVGRIGSAAYFSGNTSYFQAKSFTSLRNPNSPFSLSLWINPNNAASGGSIAHVSILQNGNGSVCYDLLALTPTGNLLIQWMASATNVTGLLGPVIPSNAWTHVALAYGATNGLRVYIDGQLSVSTMNTANLAWLNDNDPLYIILGNISPFGSSAPIVCRVSGIPYVPGSYVGGIDEFRLYNRELDNQEICALADL